MTPRAGRPWHGSHLPPTIDAQVAVDGETTGHANDSVGGTDPPLYDKLVIPSGSARLAGALQVELLADFMPDVNNFFAIVTAPVGGISGHFATTAEYLPPLTGGKRWSIHYPAASEHETSVVLRVLAPFEADFDEDGDVDGADLARWKTGCGLGSGAFHSQGDATADGCVDGADFLVWQRQLGSHAYAAAAANAVPEPPAVGLACIVVAAVAGARRGLIRGDRLQRR